MTENLSSDITNWKRAPRRTTITLVPGDPLYEHLLQANPKKLERLKRDEMNLYLTTHAPDYEQKRQEASQRVQAWDERLRKHKPDYQLLGLAQFEGPMSRQRVVAAYRRKAKELHPDTGGNHEQMIELNAAYQRVLAALRAE